MDWFFWANNNQSGGGEQDGSSTPPTPTPEQELLDIGWDMALGTWWTGSFLNASANPATSGEAVATMLDQTGNANHGTQSVGSERGIFTDAQTPNGLPAMVSDNVDDGFVTPLNLGSAYTICMVVKCTPIIATRCANSLTANRLITPGRVDYAVYPGDTVVNDLSAYSGVWVVCFLRINGSAAAFRINGVDLASAQVGDVWGTLSYGYEGAFGEPSNSSLAGYLAVNRYLTDEETDLADGLLTALTGVNAPFVDPLAGKSFPLRVESYQGFDPTASPQTLFQDTSCLVPAVNAGQNIQGVFDAWTNEAKQADQSNSMKAPKVVIVNGRPVMRFDGSDDWLLTTLGLIGGQITYSVLLKSNAPTWSSYGSPLDRTVDDGTSASRWGLFGGGSTAWWNDPAPSAVSKNGVPLVAPYNMGTITDWMILTVRTADAGANLGLRGIGQLEQSYYVSFDLDSLIIHSDADTADVQAYLETKRLALL